MNIQLAVQTYKSKSTPLSAQQLVNFYAEKEPAGAKSPVAIFGGPGLMARFTVGTGPLRGMHVMNNVLYVVSGDSLYSVNSFYQTRFLGAGISGLGVVRMADNGVQVGIVNGLNTFIYNATTDVYQQINDPNAPPAATITYMDGYFLFDKAGSNEFYYSGILDGTSYNALDFDTAEVSPGFLLALCNQQQNLLVFTQNVIETWFDSGANDSPFQRFNGATVERGCAAAQSIVKEDNSVFFLGNDRIFYRLNLPQPLRISQPAIEQEWQTYPTVSDCFCFNINFEGHKFIVVTFPSAPNADTSALGRTFIYDISTDLWHERVSFLSSGTSLGRWRANCSVVFNNVTLIGDAFGNQVGELSSTQYTEYGAPIIGTLVAPAIQADRRRIFHANFELDMETGVGLLPGAASDFNSDVNPDFGPLPVQGSDPQIMLDWSDDGARTWKSPQKWSALGKIGAYQQRVRWQRLGQSRTRIYRVQISDPVRRTIIAARGDYSVGGL